MANGEGNNYRGSYGQPYRLWIKVALKNIRLSAIDEYANKTPPTIFFSEESSLTWLPYCRGRVKRSHRFISI